jgi:heptosyltransferase III
MPELVAKRIVPGVKMPSASHGTPRVLIVRPGALGDTILSLPLPESIRVQNPAAKIVFLGTRAYRDLIPTWAEFQPMDDPQWLWLFAPEGAVLPEHGPSFDRAYVVLNQPDDVIRNLARAGVRSIIHTPSRPQTGEHVVERMHRGLGLTVPEKAPALSHPASRKENLIWIHPGSGGPGKCVPLDFLIRFVESLGDVTAWSRAVTAGEEDAFLREHTEWEALISAPRTRLLEQRPLPELCATLGSASLFIGNDSGISHLAAALGVPSVVFFVSTDPAQWSPWVPPHQVRVMDVRGMALAAADAASLVSRTRDFFYRQ